MEKREKKNGSIFQHRLEKHHDELRWLYMELYQNGDMFAELKDISLSGYEFLWYGN